MTDIDYAVVPKLNEGESLVVYVDVGNLPTQQAMEYLENIRNQFVASKTIDTDGNKIIFAPMRDGQKTVVFEKVITE